MPDDEQGVSIERMGRVNDSDVIEYLLGHYGIVVGLAFYLCLARRSTTILLNGS